MTVTTVTDVAQEVRLLPVDLIDPNPDQPRRNFDQDRLEQLGASVASVGILQPITVRNVSERWQIVMGERRWRAAKAVGLAEIPALVRTTGDEHLLRDALLENIQRDDLNPMEEARAYRQLSVQHGMSHQEIASLVSKSRTHVTKLVSFLSLPDEVQQRVAAGVLSCGHAKALVAVREPGSCSMLARRAVAELLPVRAVEELVAAGNLPGFEQPIARKKRARYTRPDPSREVLEAVESLEARLDTTVKIVEGRDKGRITIEFGGRGDLARVLAALEPSRGGS